MALEEIKYGSLASSSLLNKNYEYLDERINEANTLLNTKAAQLSTKIENVNTNLTNTIASNKSSADSSVSSLNSSIDSLRTTINNGRYVTSTWRSGASWWRYWSDGWIEQGGTTGSLYGGNDIYFPRTFATTDYSYANTADNLTVNKYTNHVYVNAIWGNGAGGYYNVVSWYAAGY